VYTAKNSKEKDRCFCQVNFEPHRTRKLSHLLKKLRTRINKAIRRGTSIQQMKNYKRYFLKGQFQEVFRRKAVIFPIIEKSTALFLKTTTGFLLHLEGYNK
jgi:hypothetical protein